MVRIINCHLREGERGSFVSLEVQGDPELVMSQNSGRWYITAKRAFLSTTFDFEIAQRMVGTQFRGSIIRVQTDPYDFTIPDSGEVIQLSHRYDYSPEESQLTNISLVNQHS